MTGFSIKETPRIFELDDDIILIKNNDFVGINEKKPNKKQNKEIGEFINKKLLRNLQPQNKKTL